TTMKRTNLLFSSIIIIMLFASCATSKEARSYRKSVNGSWQLQTVVTEGITGKIKAQVFNEADFNCFVGSSWSFNQNNSLGSYTIAKNAGECVAIKREFRWSVYEAADQPKLLQFKRLDNKLKEIDEAGGGFRFTIIKVDNTSMQLKSDITFEGRPASFTYNFVKN
ncbi:MAG: lipocalin family protein, partial [Ferruginibacter sp.]